MKLDPHVRDALEAQAESISNTVEASTFKVQSLRRQLKNEEDGLKYAVAALRAIKTYLDQDETPKSKAAG